MSRVITMPPVAIELGGVPLAAGDARALAEIRIQQRLSLPTLCILRFQEPDEPMLDRSADLLGAPLGIRIEGVGGPDLFDGEVSAVEVEYGPARDKILYIRAYDLLHRLRQRQPVGAHIQVTAAELAQTLAADLGLAVEADAPGPLIGHLIQYDQSDLELLDDVTQRAGLYFTLRLTPEGRRFKLITLEGSGAAVGLSLDENLLEARIERNAGAVCRRVEATGWNPHRVEPHAGSAERPRSGLRIATAPPAGRLHESGWCTIVDAPVENDLQAEAIAQAELDRRTAREVVLSAVAEGDPRLQPGVPVDISGVAAPLSGRYVLTGVTHRIDRSRGFVSEIDTAPPPAPDRSRATVTTWAVVSRVDDPEGAGRVRVLLPGYGGLETGWLHVAIPGAGPKKGIVALPDVDDRVLVLLIGEDPAQGVVIGGLYGVGRSQDVGVEDGAVRRYSFATPGGQIIRLDDAKESIGMENSHGEFIRVAPGELRLEDRQGSRFELTPDRCRIHSRTDLDIEAPGATVTVRAASINFEKAT